MTTLMKFHPSSIGLIMGDAQSVDIALVPANLRDIAKKPRKTEADREALLPYKEASLSATAKSYLNALAKQFVYGYNKTLDVKYLAKGIALEDPAIEFINAQRFKNYVKNTVRLEDEYLTGECDILVPGMKTIDTKVAWDLDTFPSVSDDAHDMMYEWQGRGYMRLYDVPEHEVCFIMLDTPDEMIRYEQRELHKVSHIDPALRITSITYKRDAGMEEKMISKCKTAHEYLAKRVAQINIEHRL